MSNEDELVALSESLPSLSYFAILGLPHRYAAPAEVKRAFHLFAERYHPDVFALAPSDVRGMATEAFKRAVEAYEALRDAQLQRIYVENYLKRGFLRLPPAELARARSVPPPAAPSAAPPATPSPSRPAPPSSSRGGPSSWVGDVMTRDGREIAERVERLVQAGKWREALVQIQLIENLEPDNLKVKIKRNALRRKLDAK